MRRSLPLTAAALMLCAGCSTAGTTAGADAASEPTFDRGSAVRAAVAATSRGPAQLDQKIEISGGGVDATITVIGGIDFAADKAALAVDFPEGGISHLDEVFAGRQAYVRGAAPVDADTWAVTARDAAEAHYALRAPLNDPQYVLRQISAMRHVSQRGEEEVAGTHTVHFRGVLDHDTLTLRMAKETREKMAKARDLIGGDLPVYADAWVDQQGRLVQTRTSMDLGGSQATVTTVLSGPGKPVQVTVPATDNTVPAGGFTGILTG
ncbi:hypothetical protein ABR738_07280 [Streptomyces sp. Edi4]|uniref:hypothetical protein n=1 Tax=Streptomyces sp. Edi4 TaxID=3162527 RepID=UPI003305703D